MFFRILKKDLKRKKTMNMILFLFIILATMFVASGLNNVIAVVNGTDYYLDKAGMGDYVVITMGEDAVGNIDLVLKKEECVKSYKIEPVIFCSAGRDNVYHINGEKISMNNPCLFQSIDDAGLSYFDRENQKISQVAPGHVYIGGSFLKDNDLEAGDKVCIKYESVNMELVIDGKAKDAVLGSEFMGNQRFLLNDADMQKLAADETIQKNYRGEIGYIETDDIAGVSSAVSAIRGIAFDGSRSTIKTCYLMDMLIAFLILILSICLIIVSFMVLKFSITFTIMEEFREIGVMKAIGIGNGRIRALYLGKYLALALAGALLGFFASIPFGDMLLQSASENMLLGNDMGILINLLGAAMVIALILLFAWHCTGKVKKSSPISAIRSGQTGERYQKKGMYRLGKSHLTTDLYMAVNDLLSSPKRFVIIMLSFFLCTLFVLMVVNTTATMESPNLIDTFGARSDLYVEEINDASTKEDYQAYLAQKAEKLNEQGMPAETSVQILYKYPLYFDGREYGITCQQGLNAKAKDYVYSEGSAPQNAGEIAITPQISERTGAKIGDTVSIDFGTEKRDCVVTAYFQTMNQLGEVIRLHEDAPTDFHNLAVVLQLQISFTDSPDAAEMERRKERIKDLYHNDDVMDATEYCVDCIGVVDTMKAVQYSLLLITLIVVLLVTILMEHSFIADERNQIAILKAIGFRNRDIICWHTYRFAFIALLSVFLAALASIPMTELCISPIFGIMGASDVKYNIDPLQIFLLYPAVVFAMAVLIAWLNAFAAKKISCRDIANME